MTSVQLFSCVRLFETPWTATRQSSLSITNSWSLPRLMSIESVMPSNHLILCHPLLLLHSIFPSIRFLSNESALRIRWPKYWSFSFNISPSNEHSGLISFRMDWLDLLAIQGTLKSLLQHHSSKASILWSSAFFIVQLSHPYMTTGKTIALTRRTFVGKVMSLLFNMLSRLVITFLPRSKHLLISWLQSLSAVILEPPKIKSATVSIVFSSICDLGLAKQIHLCKMRKAVVSIQWRDWILCQAQGNLWFFECSGQGNYVFNCIGVRSSMHQIEFVERSYIKKSLAILKCFCWLHYFCLHSIQTSLPGLISLQITQCAQSLSRLQLFVTTWTAPHQAPLSMWLSRQGYWSRLPFPPPGDLADPRIKLVSPVFPALAGRLFTTVPPGKPNYAILCNKVISV